jgi:Flp pilus assembly pilin Flp
MDAFSNNKSESAATMIEYAIVLSLLALVILALSNGISTSASEHYSTKAPSMNQAYPQGFIQNPTPTAN